MKFIEIHVRNAITVHGYDKNNKLIQEKIEGDEIVKKIIALERVLSISEQYLLVRSIDGRECYWEYQESFDEVKQKLLNHDILIL